MLEDTGFYLLNAVLAMAILGLNEIYLLTKYIKSVLWRAAVRLSYI
jgi:hypothetical protein